MSLPDVAPAAIATIVFDRITVPSMCAAIAGVRHCRDVMFPTAKSFTTVGTFGEGDKNRRSHPAPAPRP
jgi:hypothetical protein